MYFFYNYSYDKNIFFQQTAVLNICPKHYSDIIAHFRLFPGFVFGVGATRDSSHGDT